MIPTYNCARFLRETLESVLAQDIDPRDIQIEVVDDCSTSDDPEAVVREYGQGRVSFHRKPVNQGAILNFNTCIERSVGRFVHILHGDDYVRPDFYRTINRRLEQYGDVISLYVSRCFVVDEKGELDSLTPRIKGLESPSNDPSCIFLANSIRTPGCVVKRKFYESHGGFIPALVHTADWEMWTRATALGSALFVNEPLAVYRYFEGNDTSRLARTGENMRDCYRLGQVMANLYPDYPRHQFMQGVARGAALQAARFQRMGDLAAAEANYAVAQDIKKEFSFE